MMNLNALTEVVNDFQVPVPKIENLAIYRQVNAISYTHHKKFSFYYNFKFLKINFYSQVRTKEKEEENIMVR